MEEQLLALQTIEDILEGLPDDEPITPKGLAWRILELEILVENGWIHGVETS